MASDLDLIIVVTDAAGNTKTLDPNAKEPADRPRAVAFSSQLGSGFYTGAFTLSRRIDQENVDINLGDDVRIILADGRTLYEGYVSDTPRSTGDGHTLSVTTAGWMAHAADHPFVMRFVDRDLSRFLGQPSLARRAALGTTFTMNDGGQLVADSAGMSIVQQFNRVATGNPPNDIIESVYDIGSGCFIGQFYWSQTNYDRGYAGSFHSEFVIDRLLSTDDALVSQEGPGGISTGGPDSGYYTPADGTRRYLTLQVYRLVAFTGDGEWRVNWTGLAVYGDHGIALSGSSDPMGVTAADVIRWVAANYCPLLNTAGVVDTGTVIEHLVFDTPTTPYDAFLKVNSFHLWELAVWEDRSLVFRQIDLTDWDWEIRHDEVGNQIQLQGDSFENLRNGVIVQYTDVATGREGLLLPEDYSELRDDSLDNPINQHGRKRYGDPYTIPYPTTLANALELGRLKLIEDLQVTAPGSFTVQYRIKDRSGQLQPVSLVRAGQRIRLTSSANLSDRPRLIKDVQYNDDSKTVTVAVDSTQNVLSAIQDRTTTSLTAHGLS